MKTKFYTMIFLSFIFAMSLKSQAYVPFPTDSVVWNEVHTQMSDGFNLIFDYKIYLFGDTVLKSNTYSKVYYLPDSENDFDLGIYLGGLREEDKKIYYMGTLPERYDAICGDYPDSVDLLLYDFNLGIGDTLKLNREHCETTSVNAIDSVLYDNKYRKRYYMNGSEYNVTEGIGSNKSLFYPLLYTFEWDWALDCFDKIDMSNPENCFFITDAKQTEVDKEELIIQPNPISDVSELILPDNFRGEGILQIINIQGKVVYTQTATLQQSSIQLTRDMFEAPGLYLISLNNADANIIKKIIVR